MPFAAVLMLESSALSASIEPDRPTAADAGISTASWRTAGGQGPSRAAVFVSGSEALALGAPTNGTEGPEIWGHRLDGWWRMGVLNNGADIEIAGDGQGFATEVSGIGIFDRLAVVGTPSTGNATVTIAPIQDWEIP